LRRRFFVENFGAGTAELRGETAEHLGRVLRAEPGQLYELSDGNSVWLARVERVSRAAVAFSLVEQIPVRESPLQVTLLLSLIKFDRFEWCLEKATELGVYEIVPLAAARSEKRLVAAAAGRSMRWEKILVEAAQQSRRLRPPSLREVASSQSLFRDVGAQHACPEPSRRAAPLPAFAKLLLSESPDAPSMREAVGKALDVRAVALAIGPEGGWTDAEFSAAREAGFLEVSLGRNILRTETAVIAALACLNFALGE